VDTRIQIFPSEPLQKNGGHAKHGIQYPRITTYFFLGGFYAFCITLTFPWHSPLRNVPSIEFASSIVFGVISFSESTSDERYVPGVVWGRPSKFAVGAYKNEVQE